MHGTPNPRSKLQNHKDLTPLLSIRINPKMIQSNRARIERNRSLKIDFSQVSGWFCPDIADAIWRVKTASNLKPKTVPESPWNVDNVSSLNRPKRRSEEGEKDRWTGAVTDAQPRFSNEKMQIGGPNLNETWNKLNIWKAHKKSYEMDSWNTKIDGRKWEITNFKVHARKVGFSIFNHKNGGLNEVI